MSQKKVNPFGKKSSELSVVGDVARLRDAIGRPERDHSSLLDNNTSMFTSVGLSPLRQRSISSMLKNPKTDLSRLGSRRMTSDLPAGIDVEDSRM